jgi:signal transduction histidine kinase/DNA-binding response OmpR family regulator
MYKLPLSIYCSESCDGCDCGEKRAEVRRFSVQDIPSTEKDCILQRRESLFAPASDDNPESVDWDLSMKEVCETFDFDMALVAVSSSLCINDFTCKEPYHTVGRHGQDPAPNDCYNCAIVSHPESLTMFAVNNKCHVISNNSLSDPRSAQSQKMEGAVKELLLTNSFTVPLLALDGSIIGVFGAGMRTQKHWDSVFIQKILCYLSHLALTLQNWLQHLREKVLQNEMKMIVQNSLNEIRQSNQTRDTFIATMSHELRTPLTSIIAVIQILLNTPITSENSSKIGRMLQVQQNCSTQLLELINDILDFCKLRSTNLKLAEEDVKLSEVMHQCLSIFEEQCRMKHIQLYNDIKELEGLVVLSDAKRLKQITLNLLSNALKYTDKGRITLKAEVKRCSPANFRDSKQLENGDVMVTISVIDSGVGISQKNLQHIFEPYFSAKKENWSEVLNGVGLGLAISKELVNLMGGQIYAESDGVSGTKAVFSIPFRDSKYMENILKNSKEINIINQTPIMIVDDRVEQRLHMMRLVSRWGMVPHSFTSSSEALMALDVMGDYTFNVALVDVDLSESEPNDTGAIFAQNVRSRNLNMKLIAVSSVGSTFGGDQLFDYVLVKPLSEVQLFTIVKKCLKLINSNDSSIVTENDGKSVKQMSSLSGRRRPSDVGGKTNFLSIRKTNTLTHLGNQQETPPSPPRRSSFSTQKNFSILVVDDDKVNASIFKEMFENLGYEKVNAVNSAAECLFHLRKEENTDVVFLDIVMPTTDGIQCAKRIRASPQIYGNPQIIALTADALDTTRFRCLQNGFNYFLAKPVTMDDFVNTMKWIFSNNDNSGNDDNNEIEEITRIKSSSL